MNENTYGSRLLIAMEAKNATRKDLATALGVSVQAVGDVLRGKSGAFTAENNAKAARNLEVNPNWLATGNGQMKSPIDETTTYLLTKGAKYGVQPVAVFDEGDVLHSDNPDFIPRDEEVPPSVVESSISIVGRVRDKSGTGGLD